MSTTVSAGNVKALMPVFYAILLFVLIKYVLKGIVAPFTGAAQGLGLADSDDEKKQIGAMQTNRDALEKAGDDNPFLPTYVLRPKYKDYFKMIPNNATLTALCKQIWSGIGYTWDDPEKIVAAFRKLHYKSEVSAVAIAFSQMYNTDLWYWLHLKLDTTSQKISLGQIITYVNGLPSGISKTAPNGSAAKAVTGLAANVKNFSGDENTPYENFAGDDPDNFLPIIPAAIALRHFIKRRKARRARLRKMHEATV